MDWSLTLLLRGKAYAIGVLPRAVQLALGRGLGALLRALGIRERVVRENLERAFPGEARAAERAALCRRSYEHLGQLFLEVLLLLGPMPRFARRSSELRGLEHWKSATAQGKGVIFLASHVGNWEVMAATGALQGGMQLTLVTKHLKPEWFHRAIEAGRRRCSVAATYEPRTLKDVLARLKEGKTVGFVLDQYAGPPVGVRVPVFGTPVSTTTAIAALARRTGAAVLPVVNYRTPEGRFVVDIRPPLVWQAHEDPHYELAANTALYAATLEKDIYAHPEQWLWIHRRFKGDLSPLREEEWRSPRARR